MKRRSIHFLMLAVLVMLFMTTATLAEVPRTISYQGKATDTAGNPVPDGDYQVRFYIYNHPTAGTALWMESFFTIHTTDGYFTHLLGSLNPIPDSLFANNDSLYLAVMFNGEWLSPRTAVATAGYAFRVNSVKSTEIRDEPGIACNGFWGYYLLEGYEMHDIETVTLTIPAGGYIFVEAKFFWDEGSTRSQLVADVQIDETQGGDVEGPYYSTIGRDSTLLSTRHSRIGYASRVYYKSVPGEYTFRLEAKARQGNGSIFTFNNPILVATYFPTAYGEVSATVTGIEAGQFEEATPVNVDGETMYKVDLRELELRAAKAEVEAERARANAEKAKADLIRAQMDNQQGTTQERLKNSPIDINAIDQKTSEQ